MEACISRKSLLIIGAGIEQVPAIKLAKSFGWTVLATDGNPKAPGLAFADDHRAASTYDVTATIAAAAQLRQARSLDGVMTIASDVPVTVAAVAKRFGLPGLDPETARLASDKILMKRALKAAGVPVPWFTELGSPHELKNLVKERGFPCVIKPVDSRGARGVLCLTRGVDLDWAFRHSRAFSPTKRVMAEEYLAGPQISSESIVWDGKIWTPGLADRNYEMLKKFAPFIIENGGELPSRAARGREREITRVLLATARALGLKRGNLKGDLVVTKNGVHVIEVAARLSGGYFATHEIPLSTGVDLVGESMRLALGMTPRASALKLRRHRGIAIRYFFPPPGRLTAVEGVQKLARLPWVKHWGVYVNPGKDIPPVTDHTKRAGFVLTSGRDRAQAVRRARAAIRSVRFIVKNGR